MRLLSQDDQSLDYGAGIIQFSLETAIDGEKASPGNGIHVAFMAEGPGVVDEFYRVALEHRGAMTGPLAYVPNPTIITTSGNA